ncbi:nitrate- and nitrite sensing domain-containing protein [Streptomyces sp. NPDC002588]|uniref:sensor histidine kinase n=1 Tax=Streptomyces sp. NPDC002588 TaxID=3154419 RepID=UPI00332D1608
MRSTTGRGRSIRASLIALAVAPAVAMILLWATGAAVQLDQWHKASEEGNPAKTTYALVPGIGMFQKERQLTVRFLSSDGSRADLDAQRRRTDLALAAFHKADSSSAGDGSAQYQDQLGVVRKRLDDLTAERAAVDGGKTTRRHAYDVYSKAVSSVLNLFGMLSTDNGSGATAAEAGHALAFMRATEALSREEALLDGVTASGRLTVQERTDLVGAAAVRVSVLSDEVAPYLPEDSRAALEKVMGGRDWAATAAYEKALTTAAPHDGTVEVARATTARAAAPGHVSAEVQDVQNQYLPTVTKNAADRNRMLLDRVLVGSALALVAVLAVAVLCWRITRSLIGRMAGLRAATLELAQDRLPELIARLRTEGSRAGLDGLPELDYGSDELGRVAEAFNSAQRTAVSVALEQASLREGARQVFHNMSRRIQVLVHRQLTVIDGMERKEQDPQLLADLYRVDHLATRMRRNAESLTVLSGAAPRRRWKQAVPLADLLRSAVSEIEDYARVVVEPMPPTAVAGPAVGDTIHLMAELIENGVIFSPPHTEVRVRALPVAQGYAIEVEDRGLGLSAAEYEAANELLHDPKDFSLSTLGEDPRLGLFTVGHLARRHGITPTLQASSYGGTLAVVVLPQSLTEPVTATAPPASDARAERHLASVAHPAGAGVTSGGMPMRTRKAPRPQTPPAPAPPTAPAVPSSGTVPPRAAPPLRETGPLREAVPFRTAAPSVGPRADGSGRLPRRVRQASLAPQLRERPGQPDGDPGRGRETVERRPEQARSMLAALRDGTRRARAQEEVPAPVWPSAPTERHPLPARPRPTRNTP